MKSKDNPGMHRALVTLSSLFPTFYDVFESGIDHAKSYFETHKFPYNPWLHADLVRNWAKNALDGHNLKTEYEASNLANAGIQLTVKEYFIRIRKALNGEIPSPGRSVALSQFYRQCQQLFLSSEFSDMHNLLLLWKTNNLGDFKGLSLVYPLSANTIKWRAEIPHPAEQAEIVTAYQASLEEWGDLDIEPLEEDNDDLQEEGQ